MFVNLKNKPQKAANQSNRNPDIKKGNINKNIQHKRHDDSIESKHSKSSVDVSSIDSEELDFNNSKYDIEDHHENMKDKCCSGQKVLGMFNDGEITEAKGALVKMFNVDHNCEEEGEKQTIRAKCIKHQKIGIIPPEGLGS